MSQNLPGIDVLFVAGFGPISQNAEVSSGFYVQVLGLPLKPMEGNGDYLLSENRLKGVKHFAVWPLSQAATSCFGSEEWPAEHPIPQGWIEYEVQDLFRANGKRIRMQFATKGEAFSHERCLINSTFDLQSNTRLTRGLYFMKRNLNSGVR